MQLVDTRCQSNPLSLDASEVILPVLGRVFPLSHLSPQLCDSLDVLAQCLKMVGYLLGCFNIIQRGFGETPTVSSAWAY